MLRHDIRFKAVGNWEAVDAFLGGLAPKLKRASRDAQNKLAGDLIKIVRGHLLAQDLPWKPISSSTALKKGNFLILIDTELYLDSIKKWTENGVVMVGVKKGIMYKTKKGSIEVSRVAAMHEVGGKRIPKRPLWGPSVNELGGAKGMKATVASILADRVNKHYKETGAPIRVSAGSILKYVK